MMNELEIRGQLDGSRAVRRSGGGPGHMPGTVKAQTAGGKRVR